MQKGNCANMQNNKASIFLNQRQIAGKPQEGWFSSGKTEYFFKDYLI
jgi:hypothetical protein